MGLPDDHDIDRLCYGARAVKVPSGEPARRASRVPCSRFSFEFGTASPVVRPQYYRITAEPVGCPQVPQVRKQAQAPAIHSEQSR